MEVPGTDWSPTASRQSLQHDVAAHTVQLKREKVRSLTSFRFVPVSADNQNKRQLATMQTGSDNVHMCLKPGSGPWTPNREQSSQGQGLHTLCSTTNETKFHTCEQKRRPIIALLPVLCRWVLCRRQPRRSWRRESQAQPFRCWTVFPSTCGRVWSACTSQRCGAPQQPPLEVRCFTAMQLRPQGLGSD